MALARPDGSRIEAAAQAFRANGWQVFVSADLSEARAHLVDLIPPQARVVVRPGPAWQRLALDDHLTEHASVSYFGGSWAGHDSSTDRARILAADVGVTGATALVMETATALLAADDAWGQLVSGLPFTHVVVAPAFKLVDTLPEGLALVRRYSELALSKPLARYVAGISGPSRTGDIEMIIVQGMHGPGRVHLLLLDVEPGAEMLGGYRRSYCWREREPRCTGVTSGRWWLDRRGVRRDKRDLLSYAYDATGERYLPDLWSSRRTTQVADCVRLAAEAGMPVVPRGAGGQPLRGGTAHRGRHCVLNLVRMNRGEAIDPEARHCSGRGPASSTRLCSGRPLLRALLRAGSLQHEGRPPSAAAWPRTPEARCAKFGVTINTHWVSRWCCRTGRVIELGGETGDAPGWTFWAWWWVGGDPGRHHRVGLTSHAATAGLPHHSSGSLTNCPRPWRPSPPSWPRVFCRPLSRSWIATR